MGNIVLENVCKTFPGSKNVSDVRAVDDVSFVVEDKEFLVILGPSGCGKTTTLRLVAGLERVDSGEIYIGGRNITKLPERSRDVAMVFQQYALYPHMSVEQNIGFPLKLAGIRKADAKPKVDTALEILGMKDLAGRYPSELSGGQKQRVALGRAIVRNPKAFLMDEPLSNLDAKLRVRMRSEIKDIQTRLEITTLYVTHDQSEAMSIADRIIVMGEGKIVQIGSPRDIYRNPVNRYVAAFIGTPAMSFLSGKLVQAGDTRCIDFGSAQWAVSPSVWDRISTNRPGDRITVGIRPRDVGVEFSDEEGTIPAEVVMTELEGDDEIIHLKIGNDTFRVLVNSFDLPRDVHTGDRIWITMDDGKAYFFDPDSGVTIP